ncbi:hypothetical protein PENTCL1PPCAC_27471, partial [Pristionchus entomophagus]
LHPQDATSNHPFPRHFNHLCPRIGERRPRELGVSLQAEYARNEARARTEPAQLRSQETRVQFHENLRLSRPIRGPFTPFPLNLREIRDQRTQRSMPVPHSIAI